MRVIYSYNPKVADLASIRRIKDAVTFCADNLNLLDENHTVKIELRYKLDGDKLAQGYFEGSSKISTIRIRYNSDKTMIKTLFHEMQHLKQYLSGRLRYYDHIPIWDGKPYNIRRSSLTYFEYLALPWEIDARNAEAMLYKKWWRSNTTFGRIYTKMFMRE